MLRGVVKFIRPSIRSVTARSLPCAQTILRNMSASVSSESHDDFKPVPKAPTTDKKALQAEIDEIVSKHKVVLFMKGVPKEPRCGFSARVVQILHAQGVDIYGVNVLASEEIRQFMKDYSQWPTFPQLYINGEFVGGCDIVTQLNESGELAKLLAAPAPTPSK